MKKNILVFLITISVLSCDKISENVQGGDESNNYIQWSNGNALHDEMIRSGINHFLNIEREKAYVFFEKAIKLDSTSFAAHVVISSMSRPNSKKQETHYELAKKHFIENGFNEGRFF